MHKLPLTQSVNKKSIQEVQNIKPEKLLQSQKKAVFEIDAKQYFFTELWKDYSGHPGDCNCLFCNF